MCLGSALHTVPPCPLQSYPLAVMVAAASPSVQLPLAVFALLFMLQRIFHNAFVLTAP
jgi:hypothetical protein